MTERRSFSVIRRGTHRTTAPSSSCVPPIPTAPESVDMAPLVLAGARFDAHSPPHTQAGRDALNDEVRQWVRMVRDGTIQRATVQAMADAGIALGMAVVKVLGKEGE